LAATWSQQPRLMAPGYISGYTTVRIAHLTLRNHAPPTSCVAYEAPRLGFTVVSRQVRCQPMSPSTKSTRSDASYLAMNKMTSARRSLQRAVAVPLASHATRR
jgi:hypothetical protein